GVVYLHRFQFFGRRKNADAELKMFIGVCKELAASFNPSQRAHRVERFLNLQRLEVILAHHHVVTLLECRATFYVERSGLLGGVSRGDLERSRPRASRPSAPHTPSPSPPHEVGQRRAQRPDSSALRRDHFRPIKLLLVGPRGDLSRGAAHKKT